MLCWLRSGSSCLGWVWMVCRLCWLVLRAHLWRLVATQRQYSCWMGWWRQGSQLCATQGWRSS